MMQALVLRFRNRMGLVLLVNAIGVPAPAQTVADPHKLVAEADRLAWMKAWTRAEPIYAEAEQLFTAVGDRRNALYARINRLRGELPRLPVPEVSDQLAEYLEDPLVQADDRLRLRTLILKGETDTDLDPVLAERSWREAMAIAERLGEAGWANRARGELGLLAFLQGNVNAAVIQLGQALKVAESSGDTPSVVRWLTLFGHGYVELDRPAEALDMYDRALKVAGDIPELQFPAMTYVGKGDALQKLGQLEEAERLLDDALAVAAKQGALGYQADLLIKLAEIAQRRKDLDRAAQLLANATDLGHQAGGGRLVALASLERARVLRLQNRVTESERVLDAGISAARSMQERLLLPSPDCWPNRLNCAHRRSGTRRRRRYSMRPATCSRGSSRTRAALGCKVESSTAPAISFLLGSVSRERADPMQPGSSRLSSRRAVERCLNCCSRNRLPT